MSSTATKTVLITGCSKGIGLCAAHILKARGYRVFATARKSTDIKQLEALGFETEMLNLTDTHSIDNAVNNILQKTEGQLDILINNAGYLVIGAVEDLTIDVFKSQFETNFFGTVYLTNKIIPIMRQQTEGRIVFISSVNGYFSTPYAGAYTASKFALEGLVETLAMELTDSPIRVSLIEPGFIKTNLRNIAFPDRPDSPHARYYQQIKKMYHSASSEEKLPFIKPPVAVVKKIIFALEKRAPKLRYRVTPLAYFLAILKYVLPDRMRFKFILTMMKKQL